MSSVFKIKSKLCYRCYYLKNGEFIEHLTNLWTVIAARMAPKTKTTAKSVLTHTRQLIWALILRNLWVCFHSFIAIF